MVDPARLIINCVERGKVSAEVIVLRLMGHAITYGNVACDQNIIGRTFFRLWFKENRERELGLDRRETG